MTFPGRAPSGAGASEAVPHEDAPPVAAPGSARAERAERVDDLLTAVARGDQVAFAALYDETAPMVHGTALRVLHDPDQAAEVTQEVLLEVWRTAGRFDPERGSALAWVATMAHRRAVDRVRAVQAQRDRDHRASARDYDRPFDEVAETVVQRAERDRVLNCLGSLSDLQRDAVTRAYYGGRTYREVAEDVAASLPTVKSRIRDGLLRLRTCLGMDR
ncbi:ECF RNA polymerase sigma factor SigK [Georgenia muralis]